MQLLCTAFGEIGTPTKKDTTALGAVFFSILSESAPEFSTSPETFAPAVAVLQTAYRVLYSMGIEGPFVFNGDEERSKWAKALSELRKEINTSAVLKASTSVSHSTLLLEVSKIELLVTSLPDAQEVAKLMSAGKSLVSGAMKLASFNPAGFKDILKGVVGAATVGVLKVQRAHATKLVENFCAFIDHTQTLLGMFARHTAEFTDTDVATHQGYVLDLYMERVHDVQGEGAQEPKPRRWEVQADFATFLTTVILGA